jgi:23S rRNA (uracil1939-C5)-methyltransferase
LAAVTSAVTSAIGPPAAIADLFSGCGTFALPLATQARVHAVEGDAAMITALATGARQATGLRPLTTEVRDLFRRPLLTAELDYGAVVIDPPRAGAEAQCRELAQSAVPRIAAVSCNPVTFARDARILTQGGYVLDWVQVIDQFRWSAHVELAAAFSKADS